VRRREPREKAGRGHGKQKKRNPGPEKKQSPAHEKLKAAEPPRVVELEPRDIKQLPRASIAPGMQIWTCRAGYERDLATELKEPTWIDDALIASKGARVPVPTFARQGFTVRWAGPPDVDAITRELNAMSPAALHAWSADSDAGNRLAPIVAELAIKTSPPDLREARELGDSGAKIAQLCMIREDLIAVGEVNRGDAVSIFPGGRARMRVSSAAPSRSAMKLAEAIAVFGMGPERGDVCVDLGAAPGGWTFIAVERGARVFAVDRAKLDPRLLANPKVTHVEGNAFTWMPDETVDWLLCDMVHKPLEVARLIAKWGNASRTRFVIANFKLPMKMRAEVVRQVREILKREGGFKEMRTRQLYHDRDEITACVWR
jgi:23S rRNA (cytidine2498-2'-O)-methyltransferase